MRRFINGFSLIEVLIVLVVIGILVQFSLPSLQAMQQGFVFKQQVAMIRQMLSSSREHAIVLQTRVALCPLQGNVCGSDWNDALVMFIDKNNNYQLEAGEQVLQVFKPLTLVQSQRTFNNKAISFNGRGHAGIATGTLVLCVQGVQMHQALFVISRAGRVRFEQTSAQQPNLKMPNGQPVTCG